MNITLKTRHTCPLAGAFLAILLLAACSSSEQKTSSTPQTGPASDTPAVEAPVASGSDTTFRPGFFTSFPDTLSGCSSYFTYDTTAMETGRYIFLTNYGDLALIKMDGKEIYLHKDKLQSRKPAEEEGTDIFRGEGYTATLVLKKIRSMEEVTYYTGILRITGKGATVQYRVHGEAGC